MQIKDHKFKSEFNFLNLRFRVRFIFLIFCHLTMISCVKSIEDNVLIKESPSEDLDYAKALATASQSRTVFKEFETRFQVTATYLSPEFRAAFVKRIEKIYKKSDLNLSEAADKAGFFISIHSPEDTRVDLTNPHHWTIGIIDPANPATLLRPILIKKLSDKERWRAFFDSVTQWTTEYLVIFDSPSVSVNNKLVNNKQISLTLANADAEVNLKW